MWPKNNFLSLSLRPKYTVIGIKERELINGDWHGEESVQIIENYVKIF